VITSSFKTISGSVSQLTACCSSCPLYWQVVFVHYFRALLPHFRNMLSLKLCHLQKVFTFILSYGEETSFSFAGDITTPETFLKAIGRGSETKMTFDTWDALWKTDGQALKKAGLAVRDRRCVLFTHVPRR
jgi:hypothetical protein